MVSAGGGAVNEQLSREEKDLLLLMPPSHAKEGLSEKDIPKLLKELDDLRQSAALLSLLHEGKVVMRVVKGRVCYFAPQNDPLL